MKVGKALGLGIGVNVGLTLGLGATCRAVLTDKSNLLDAPAFHIAVLFTGLPDISKEIIFPENFVRVVSVTDRK